MGWDYLHLEKGRSIKDFLREEFTHSGENYSYKVLDCAIVNLREAYLAVEHVDETGNREVYAVVCLLNYTDDYYNFGFKSIDETMGPYQYNCPKRILELLTPTENKYAQEWRAKCWERLKEKAARPKLQKGMVICFTKPIRFTNGRVESVFRVEDVRRLLLSDRSGNRYKIRRYCLDEPFEVLADFPA
ncbi:hypothetical protein [Gelria sp. Kuro-4]|uniref:DUF6927 domain-containing protein n=1 Tax=Gelria sp. Kuro-4 TaxID=2796927 RepID=UPI001BF0681F|nr:hypothetical protein [Gelria sp. Kuro-4]BCV23258.1 hypothetical protein kuro4_00310 [Gelria sp. Kuro-4]